MADELGANAVRGKITLVRGSELANLSIVSN